MGQCGPQFGSHILLLVIKFIQQPSFFVCCVWQFPLILYRIVSGNTELLFWAADPTTRIQVGDFLNQRLQEEVWINHCSLLLNSIGDAFSKLKIPDPLNYWLHVRSNQSSLEIFLLSSLRAAVHCTLGELSINYADLGWMMANASITICNMKIFPFHTWALIYIFLKHRTKRKIKVGPK